MRKCGEANDCSCPAPRKTLPRWRPVQFLIILYAALPAKIGNLQMETASNLNKMITAQLAAAFAAAVPEFGDIAMRRAHS